MELACTKKLLVDIGVKPGKATAQIDLWIKDAHGRIANW